MNTVFGVHLNLHTLVFLTLVNGKHDGVYPCAVLETRRFDNSVS